MASTFSFSRRVRGQDIVLAHVPLPSPEMTQNSSNFGLTFEGEGVNRSGLRSLSSICAGTSAWLLPGRGFLTVKKPCPVVQQTAPAPRRNRYEGEHHPEIYLWAVCTNAPQLYYLRAQPWGGRGSNGVLSLFPLPLMYYLLLCQYEHSLSSISTEDSDCHKR